MIAWYVVYTHPHAETKVLAHLERQGFRAYLPSYRTRRRHARKVEDVRRPLFPRYLFVAFDEIRERWRPILSTVGVCSMVRHGERPTPVPSEIVEAIRAGEDAGSFDRTAAGATLGDGDPVRIIDGPFADLIGRFCALADGERVIVLLDLLGRQVRARLPLEDVTTV